MDGPGIRTTQEELGMRVERRVLLWSTKGSMDSFDTVIGGFG